MLDIVQIVLVASVFIVVTLGAWLLLSWVIPDKWQRRVDAIRGNRHSVTADTLSRATKVAQALGKWSGDAANTALAQQLAQLGYRDRTAVAVYGGLRILLCGVLLMVAWIFVPGDWQPSLRQLAIMVAAALGFYLPKFVLTHRIQEHQLALTGSLPDALDLMMIAIDAGLGLDHAMMRVTRKIGIQSKGLSRELEAAWMEIQAGVPRATALRNLAERTNIEDINLLVTLLNSADQLGVPVSGTLRNFSATLRLKRHQRAEEQAAKVPTKLLFPLVFFILPVLLMVLVGPASIRIIRALTSMQ